MEFFLALLITASQACCSPLLDVGLRFEEDKALHDACAGGEGGGVHHYIFVRPCPFFQDRNCRKAVIPAFDGQMRGLKDAQTVQKVQPICPQHVRGPTEIGRAGRRPEKRHTTS